MQPESSKDTRTHRKFLEGRSPSIRQGEWGKGPPSQTELRRKGWISQGEWGRVPTRTIRSDRKRGKSR